MRRLFVLVALLLGVPEARPADFQFLQSLRNLSYETVHANDIGRDFHIYTMLPDSYVSEPKRSYPTVYLLDGGALMPLISAYYRYLRLAEEVDEMIIVAISYGSSNFEGGNYRSTDYTAPSAEREWYGGAESFRDFLEHELMPLVEEKYRADKSRRIVFGHSIGGQFVLYAAQTKPELFWGHIASNPALHRNLAFFLDTVPDDHPSARVFVGSAANDDPRFRIPARKWIDAWTARESLPFELRTEVLPGHSHLSSPPAAFRQGLAWLFAVDSAN